jgi:hypothetical protein
MSTYDLPDKQTMHNALVQKDISQTPGKRCNTVTDHAKFAVPWKIQENRLPGCAPS